ncbi:MAG: Flp pilus assembly complex ATPase component TadA [Nitrospirae bacterium]|nr:Flp pilus assembly complex ATPase component TadA [Nitrospirota bacterium]
MVLKKKPIGELLVEAGAINREQLNKALEEQRTKKGRLGEILVDLGFISEDTLVEFLGKQLGIQSVDLRKVTIDPDVVNLIPESLARRFNVIPAFRTGEDLTLAMLDPLDIVAIDEIRKFTGLYVQPVAVTERAITKAIEKYYRVTGTMEEVIKDMGEAGYFMEEERAAAIEATAEETPVVRLVNLMITQAVRDRASDIHIEPDKDILRVRYRVDGILHEVMTPPKHLHAGLVSRLKILSNINIAEKRIPQDGRFPINIEGKQLDVRVSTLPALFGEKVVMRLLEKTEGLVELSELGFSVNGLEIFEKLIRRPYGFILSTGPTGSGKTTTLYSAIKAILTKEKNIVTLEDPIEYNISTINQVQVNPKAGLTFASGLRAILRQDPDIIMVGEIRDVETAGIAIHAALTGHLVLSTLHTNDAVGAIARLLDMGTEPFLISSSLIGVTAQRLVRKVCPFCKETYRAPSGIMHELNITREVNLVRGRGCKECRETGYLGRDGLFEVLPITEALRGLIVAKSPSSQLRAQAIKEGFQTLRQEGLRTALNGITTLEEVLRVTQEIEE